MEPDRVCREALVCAKHGPIVELGSDLRGCLTCGWPLNRTMFDVDKMRATGTRVPSEWIPSRRPPYLK